MAFSRSALSFVRRYGLLDESMRPAPRLDETVLRVHTVPLANPPLPSQLVLRDLDGDPRPDRNVTRPWPEGYTVEPPGS